MINIDITQLQRDYRLQPVKKIKPSGKFEDIPYNDLYYLYIQCNMSIKDVGIFLGIKDINTMRNIIKSHRIEKDLESRNTCRKNTNIAIYGTDVPFLKDSYSDRSNAYKDKTGYAHPLQNPTIKEKIKQTNIDRYGTEYSFNALSVLEKRKATMLSRYGVEHPIQHEQIKIDIAKTNLSRYGAVNPLQSNILSQKYYSVDYFSQSENVRKLVLNSKRNNKTFNTSIPEDICYDKLLSVFGDNDVIRQFKCDQYPFSVDFYIPSIDMFIECNFTWTHGNSPYDYNNLQHAEILKIWTEKSSKSDYYLNAIRTWTEIDVIKRNTAISNGLNFHEVWTIDEFNSLIDCTINLELKYTNKDLVNEYTRICQSDGNYNRVSNSNKLILHFQQNEYYKVEKKLWKDCTLRKKLYINRQQYLNKSKLTPNEILRGFKISGMHIGYSHFSPYWIKKFIKDYNITSVYDCCGGWGHRMIGAMSTNIDSYYYNDINLPAVKNVQQMYDYLKEFTDTKVTFSNNDAITHNIDTQVDVLFTCPPYWNTEIYSENGIENCTESEFINWWGKVVEKNRCNIKYLAFVINGKYMDKMISVIHGFKLKEIIQLGSSTHCSHFNKNKNNIKQELLVVFEVLQ